MESNTTDWNENQFDNVTNNATEEYERDKDKFVYSVGFLCFILFTAVVFREYLKKYHFPSNVPMFVIGLILGILDHYEHFRNLPKFCNINIEIQLFLPVIIYEFAFGMNPHTFMMAICQCIALALPGFAFCTALTAAFAKTVLTSFHWNWLMCILLGNILSVTGSEAVIELLKDYGVSSDLMTIIKGEAVLNSGVSLVISNIIVKSISTEKFELESALLEFLQSTLGGVAFGYIVSIAVIGLLIRTQNDTDIEVTFTFCAAYIVYFVSEVFLNISGILAVAVMAASLSSYKSSINYGEEETTVHQVWQTYSFWAHSWVFTSAGITITSCALKNFAFNHLAFIIAVYFMASVFRGCMIFFLTPILRNSGYGFTWKDGTLLTWGGIRGAVNLIIALLSRNTLKSNVENQDDLDEILIQVSGVVILTQFFKASTMHWVLRHIGIGQITDKNMESMGHAIALLRDAVNTTEKVTRMDKYLTGVDWPWVHRVTHIENPYQEKKNEYSTVMKRTFETLRGLCRKCKDEIHVEPTAEERKELERESILLTLRALKTSLVNQHKSYGILRRSLGHLSTCIERALDTKEKYLLSEDVKKDFLTIGYSVNILKRYMMRFTRRMDVEDIKNSLLTHCLEEDGISDFRKRCIKIYLNRRFESAIYWSLLLNIIPVATEFAIVFSSHKHANAEVTKEEIIFAEIFNGILALVYVWDAVVRIIALGRKTFFSSKENIIDFIVTVTSVVQIIYAIVLFSAFHYVYNYNSLYVLTILSAVRLVRLFKFIIRGIFKHVLNQFCSSFYHAFDLAMGFITANDEIAKAAHKTVEYEDFSNYAQFIAEKNIFDMLCFIDKIEKEHASVARAWRTHRATIYILRNMKQVAEEMENAYMIDESDAEHLLEEINSKLLEILSYPRYMKTKVEVRDILNNMEWISNDDILDIIMENHHIQNFPRREVILEADDMHPNLKLLNAGIIQISGNNPGEKKEILPNTDTFRYFYSKGNFTTYCNSPMPLGLLGYLLKTPSVTSITSSTDTQFISVEFETISQIEKQFDDLSFYMWRPIALQIAFAVLRDEGTYENWSSESLKIHLEEGILPNLVGKTEFEVHEVITDIVLIQGRVKDKNSDAVFIGPAYIPNAVRSLILIDDPHDRPQIIMVLLREEIFHSPTIMGWVLIEEITHKGLCLVHGIRKAIMYDNQSLNALPGHRRSFVQRLGLLLRPKDGSILTSEQL